MKKIFICILVVFSLLITLLINSYAYEDIELGPTSTLFTVYKGTSAGETIYNNYGRSIYQSDINYLDDIEIQFVVYNNFVKGNTYSISLTSSINPDEFSYLALLISKYAVFINLKNISSEFSSELDDYVYKFDLIFTYSDDLPDDLNKIILQMRLSDFKYMEINNLSIISYDDSDSFSLSIFKEVAFRLFGSNGVIPTVFKWITSEAVIPYFIMFVVAGFVWIGIKVTRGMSWGD